MHGLIGSRNIHFTLNMNFVRGPKRVRMPLNLLKRPQEKMENPRYPEWLKKIELVIRLFLGLYSSLLVFDEASLARCSIYTVFTLYHCKEVKIHDYS